MKIEAIETIRHEDFPNLLFVQVRTDSGTGLGETFYSAAAVETYVHTVAAPLLLGEDASRIAHLNRVLEGYVGYAGSGVETRARSAIDVALWDLAGKASGLPLHDLLGGRARDGIPAYNTCAGSHYVRSAGQATRNYGRGAAATPWEDLDRFMVDAGGLAEELVAEGFMGMKIWPFDAFAEQTNGTRITRDQLDRGLEPLRQVRAAVGDSIEVMVEMHGMWTVPPARTIVRALEDLDPYWVEDPVRADLVGGIAEIQAVTSATGTMLASGETVAQLAGFLPLLGTGSLDVVTVDIGWCGGMTHAHRIAGVCQAYGRAIAPHDCTGPVALTAATHLSVASVNALVQETVRASMRTWYPEFVTELPRIHDGLVLPPPGPGLGTELQPGLESRPGVRVQRSGPG